MTPAQRRKAEAAIQDEYRRAAADAENKFARAVDLALKSRNDRIAIANRTRDLQRRELENPAA